MLRTVKSFVKREGRMTQGQRKAFAKHWPKYGLEIHAGIIDFEKIFNRSAPTVLEIGFGVGCSLVTMAQQQPEYNYIGIEVHRPGVGILLAAIEQQNISNIRIFVADAVQILKQCIADASLDRVQIFFPDPWPKKRHHKRRLIQPTFINLMQQKLKTQGVLHLATDWENYAEHMMQVLSANAAFYNAQGTGQFSSRPAYRPITKFEQRGEKLGHPIWDLIFIKK